MHDRGGSVVLSGTKHFWWALRGRRKFAALRGLGEISDDQRMVFLLIDTGSPREMATNVVHSKKGGFCSDSTHAESARNNIRLPYPNREKGSSTLPTFQPPPAPAMVAVAPLQFSTAGNGGLCGTRLTGMGISGGAGSHAVPRGLRRQSTTRWATSCSSCSLSGLACLVFLASASSWFLHCCGYMLWIWWQLPVP